MNVFFSNSIQKQKLISSIINITHSIIDAIKNHYQDYYIQLFSICCIRCGFNFFYTYHTFDLSRCPNCGQEYCKFCMEEYDQTTHNETKCKQRFLLLYFLGLIAFMGLYLKFILMCNSHVVTKYSMVTIFLCEYMLFYNEVDGFISNCFSVKNIILGIVLLLYYNEGDILFYILIGIIQMICLVLINTITDKCTKKYKGYKEAIVEYQLLCDLTKNE